LDYGDQEDPQRFEAAACAGITFFREIRRHAFVPDVFTYCREFPSCCQSARSDTRRRGVLPLPEPPLVTYYQYLDFVFVDHNLGTGRQQFEALLRPALLLRTIVVRGGDMSVYDNVIDSLSFANTRHFILAICCECTAESLAAGLMSLVFLFESAFGQDWVKLEA